jgi:hypothetical protein
LKVTTRPEEETVKTQKSCKKSGLYLFENSIRGYPSEGPLKEHPSIQELAGDVLSIGFG